MGIYKAETCPDGYVPFTYILRFKLTGQVYYGSKYSNRKYDIAHPSKLWVRYFTSSNKIKKLIADHGVGSFDFEVRRIFNTAEDAHAWESKVLQRFNARRDPRFINGHNNDGKLFTYGPMSDEEKLKRCGPRGPRSPDVIRKIRMARVYGPMSEEQKALRRLPRGPQDPTTIAKKAAGKSKPFRVTGPDGTVHSGRNLRTFCDEHGLKQATMSSMCRGETKAYKGWTGSYLSSV